MGMEIPLARVPDAVQRETVHRRSGVFAIWAQVQLVTIPGLQRTTNVLRCARETLNGSFPELQN